MTSNMSCRVRLSGDRSAAASIKSRWIVAVAAMLVSCATPSAEAGRQPRAISTYAASSLSGTPGVEWPHSDWWRRYGDPQLDQLISTALADSPDVAAAAARARRADALVGNNRADSRPELSANASAVLSKQSYNNGIPREFVPKGYNDIGRATLNFSWELDFWGRNRAAVAAATSEAQAADADAAAARLILSTAVASAYATLAQLEVQHRLAAEAVKIRENSERLVRQSVDTGLDTIAEARTAEAGVFAAREALAAVGENRALQRNAIAALLGDGPDRGRAILAPAVVLPRALGLPLRLSSALIGRKPEVVAARWRVESAARKIGVARAGFYPAINLAALLGVQSLGLSNLVAGGSDIGEIGPALSLPIFNGGRLKAQLRGAEAEHALATAQYDGAVVAALREVADVATSSRALGDRLAQARSAVAAQEAAYKVAQLRFTVGLADYSSVLIVEDAVLQRRQLVAQLEARAFLLDVALVRALGGGFAAAPEVAMK